MIRLTILIAALALPAGPAMAQPVGVKATLDLSGSPEAVTRQAEALADQLTDAEGKIIDFDLTVVPAVVADAPDYDVRVWGDSQEPTSLRCENGWERLDRPTAFGIGFNGAYNHLLLKVLHAEPLAAPRITAACEYAGGSEHPVFHIRGAYVVSVISVPTANDIELRPVLGAPVP